MSLGSGLVYCATDRSVSARDLNVLVIRQCMHIMLVLASKHSRIIW
jgi:hypothetical protein